MVVEMDALRSYFKYNVTIFRPELLLIITRYLQEISVLSLMVFFIKSNILPERERELDAIQYVIDQIDAMKVVRPPDEVHIEAGMLCFGMTISLLGLIKEVITKTISQQNK
jgi:hypothetical protein